MYVCMYVLCIELCAQFILAHHVFLYTGNISSTLIYRYFSEAVFDIHNCINVTVSDCYFLNNHGTGIILEPFRGNTGALAISYNNLNTSLQYLGNPNIIVSNCKFSNNSAYAVANILNINERFSAGVLTGRGGAMALFINETNTDISARVSNCSYNENYAREFGGGLYVNFISLGGHNALHVSVENSWFYTNQAIRGGGGLLFTGSSRSDTFNSYTIMKCHFESNGGTMGGAVFFAVAISKGHSNVVHISQSTFVGNVVTNEQSGFGAAIAATNIENFNGQELFVINTITDW